MSETDDDELDIEFAQEDESIILMDDSCWIADPALLHHDVETEGVLAVLYRGGGVWYFDGASRQWHNIEDGGAKKARPFKSVQ